MQFLEMEVTYTRGFPIVLNYEGLEELSKLKVANKMHLASLLRNLVQAQIDCDRNIIKDELFWTQALRLLSPIGDIALISGDSHSRVFRQTIRYENRFIIPINILCGGGSASGLPNKNSRSGYGALLEDAFKSFARASRSTGIAAPLCFNFGQVDTEFVHTYRRIKDNNFTPDEHEFRDFCARLASQYVSWVKRVAPRDAFVVGVNPPCLDDAFIREAYAIQMQVYLHGNVADANGDSLESLLPGLESLEFPDKRGRTDYHHMLNSELEGEANRLGVGYIDSFAQFLGDGGCISPIYSRAIKDGVLRVGARSKDIHIGGPHALRVQAQLARRILDRFHQAHADA